MIDYPGYLASCPDLETITVDPDHSTYTAQNNCLIKDNAVVAGCKGSTIPESENITEICEGAFGDCVNLKALHIPANITSIESGAFYGCDSLKTITVSADNTEFYVKNDCLIRISDDTENPKDAIILGMNTSTIPTDDRVKSIDHYAFYGISIENLVIPENIEKIDYYGINHCKKLKTLTILSDDTQIYNGGYSPYFNGCDQVTVYCNEGSIAAKELQEREYLQNFVVYCKNHKNLVTVNAKKATATADGYTGDTKCKDCGKVIKKGATVYKASNITLSTTSYTYDGKAKTPTVTVKNSKGTKLTLNKDYTVAYASGRTNVGTYKVTVTLKGNYSGTVVKTFKINAKKVTPTVSNYPSKNYNGKAQTQKLTVKVGKTTLKSSQYTVKYTSNKSVGTATVKVTLKGNYSGSKTVTFKINPKGTALKSVAGGKKRVTVKWKKQGTQTSGYQVQYSTSKSFKGAKTVTVTSNKTTSKTIKSLKAGKKYYVRVRTYKTVGKTKYYSAWSNAKYATAKKK